MIFLLLFWDMNNIYSFSRWWYLWAFLCFDLPIGTGVARR